jgi:ribosome-associated protein
MYEKNNEPRLDVAYRCNPGGLRDLSISGRPDAGDASRAYRPRSALVTPKKRRIIYHGDMEEFILEGNEFIELNSLLKIMGLSASGGAAKVLISEGRVSVDGNLEFRKRCKIRKGQIVEFEGHQIIVK